MLSVIAFAFVAGVLTILAPCTLPVIPLVLGAGATGGRRRSLGLLAGFALTFVTLTVVVASALAAAGLTTEVLRQGSTAILAFVGLTLIVGAFEAWAGRRLAPVEGLGSRLAGGRPGDGLLGGLVLGGAIGLIWAPCVGPIMAAVIATAVVHGPSLETAAIAIAYVAGAIVPLALIAGIGRRASASIAGAVGRGRLRRGLGGAMLVAALLVMTGSDATVESAVASVLPAGWSDALLGFEQQPQIAQEIDMLRADPSNLADGPPEVAAGSEDPAAASSALGEADLGSGRLPPPIADPLPVNIGLDDLGPAPELTGITAWINTPPLTIASLKGKVVLVEFWTFACINCIHVQPYVKAWSDRYGSAGLVVIGVHTPELSFERDLDNVKDAVRTADVRFPVAFDPAFATWNAYRNEYWPAFYFIDRTGEIRHAHFGEGDYDGSEQVIRELLDNPG